MAESEVPFLVRHVAMAIYESGDVKATSKTQKITGAMDIARHRLVEYEFLRKGSEKGSVDNIKLTPKGVVADRKHKFHGPAARNRKFEKLYALISGAADEDTNTPEDNEEENEENSEEARPQRKRRTQTRHARVAKSAAGPKKKIRTPKRVRKAKQATAKRIRRP